MMELSEEETGYTKECEKCGKMFVVYPNSIGEDEKLCTACWAVSHRGKK